MTAIQALPGATLPLLLFVSMVLSAHAAEPSSSDLFESKIRPILAERCQKCHGSEKQWSGLRLDSRAAAITGGDSGPAIVSGQPADSELIKRITDTDEDARMPPAEAGPRLTAEQIDTLRQWIKQGATWPESSTPAADDKAKAWREHWAFQPIREVEPPQVSTPAFVKTPVDPFVLAKLESAGLPMSPEADRRTLIRRATYDLTGLPPTLDEVKAFENDPDPNAYEHLIDRLLESPHYGEQWGRHWLDVARYSDTKGYAYTRENRFFVHSHLYRDWVIQAINDDMPYDRFVLLQLAADEAAPDDPESLPAMGFLTLGRQMLNVTPDRIEDRIDTVCRGLMGLTVGCARCHDHKYDPIPTADYYSLYGVFQNCTERQVQLPRRSDDKKPSRKFLTELKKRQKELADTVALRRKETNEHVRSRIRDYLAAQRKLEDYPDLGVIATVEKGDMLPGFVRRWEAYLREAGNQSEPDPIFAPWLAFVKLTPEQFATDASDINAKLIADPSKLNPLVASAFATPPTSPDDVVDRYARLFTETDAKWKKACKDAKSAKAAEPKGLSDPADEALRQVLYAEDSPCIAPNEPVVNTEYLWDNDKVEEICKLQAKVDEWLEQYPKDARYAVVLNDRKTTVDPLIFRRGNPMNKGDRVPRQFLSVVAGADRKPFQHGSGRLEMAQAIVAPTNTFTTRVWVNRVWLHHFGAGLVTTPSDFGIRSTPPSHPELLDWLASEFVKHGWSTKWLHRTIMLSAAYRQSSDPPANRKLFALVQKQDPDNRLLWRMNPQRLTFEQYRDTLIADSGELDVTPGGKGTELTGLRRTVYAFVDRQYLPNVYNVFDFANPDFHIAQRSETTTAQQALFAMNSPYVADRSRKIAATLKCEASEPELAVRRAYEIIFQREPSLDEVQLALAFLQAAGDEATRDKIADETKYWTYGYGEVDTKSGDVKSFTALPHFTGSAWQGGPKWPDATLGWVRLTAKGGHVGNDHLHAAIRRWTANAAGVISIKSEISHEDTAGDGVRGWIVSSKDGVLKTAVAYNSRKRLDVPSLKVEPGETIDFVVDFNENLNSDDFTWIPTITEAGAPAGQNRSRDRSHSTWDAEENFPQKRLQPMEQFVQTLLVSNEAMFVD